MGGLNIMTKRILKKKIKQLEVENIRLNLLLKQIEIAVTTLS